MCCVNLESICFRCQNRTGIWFSESQLICRQGVCSALCCGAARSKVRDRHFWPSDSRRLPTTISVPAFMTHQCGKAARDATLPMFHAAWLSVRCIPSMGGSVFGNSTSAAVPCPSWTHGLMVEPRARKDFQTLVLGIGIHRLGHRYVPRPGRPLTSHFLSLRVSTGWWPPGFDPPAARPESVGGGRARSHGSNLLTCTEYCVQMYMVRHSAQTIVHLSETAEPMFVMA